MTSPAKILAINGSYRDDGITDQAVAEATRALRENGAEVEVITLRDQHIEFCLNCRSCTQAPGEAPGLCVHEDGMQEIIAKIEAADAYILASPTNFGAVTAVFKRFIERLIAYAYWPWGKPLPEFRKKQVEKKNAILISSSAAPRILGRWSFGTARQLKQTAATIGARPVGILFTGMIAQDKDARLPPGQAEKSRKLALKLLDSKTAAGSSLRDNRSFLF